MGEREGGLVRDVEPVGVLVEPAVGQWAIELGGWWRRHHQRKQAEVRDRAVEVTCVGRTVERDPGIVCPGGDLQSIEIATGSVDFVLAEPVLECKRVCAAQLAATGR